jgi:hypothetical protein
MKAQLILLPIVVAGIYFLSSCTKLYYTDSAGQVKEWNRQYSSDRKDFPGQ